MTLTMMFLGASLDAVIFVRWMAAAFAGPSVQRRLDLRYRFDSRATLTAECSMSWLG
jgi:hypothetical protein